MEAHATVLIGSYMIIRGLSFFLGGYPNESQAFAKLSEGNFEVSYWVYIYMLLFLGLNVVGNYVQFTINANLNKKLLEEEKIQASENFKRQGPLDTLDNAVAKTTSAFM